MTHALGRIPLAVILSLWLTTPAWASFDEGMAAFTRGEYATAFEKWLPVAEQGDADAQYYLGFIVRRGSGNIMASKWNISVRMLRRG